MPFEQRPSLDCPRMSSLSTDGSAPGTGTTDVLEQTFAELKQRANGLKQPLTHELMDCAAGATPESKITAKQHFIHKQWTQKACAKAAYKDASLQANGEIVAEVKRQLTKLSPELVKETGGNLMELPSVDDKLRAALESNNQLLKAFRNEYFKHSKGGTSFPAEFKSKLIAGFEENAISAKPHHKQRIKQIEMKKSKAESKVKKSTKLALDQTPGLQDMFLIRAINHLIAGELHELDSMIGDDGCHMRTPFVLDMHRLVQERIPKNAVQLVLEYREKTEDEQSSVLECLRVLEIERSESTTYKYEAFDFVKGDRLKESRKAKSGEYEAMLVDLTSAIKELDPKFVDYLIHVCSEGSIYWEEILDPFGLSMIINRRPIFPKTFLLQRKIAQSRLSKDYMIKTAFKLVHKEGGVVSTEEKEIGFDKKGNIQTSPSFLMVQSEKDNIAAMLLFVLQMQSAAAMKNHDRLELGPYWETARLALTYALKEGYPLIVNLRRLIVSGEGSDHQYSNSVCKTLFYEPTEKGYKYQPNPSKKQQSQGALSFQGFSMLRKGDTDVPAATVPISQWVFQENPEEFLDGFTSCDAANLMLLNSVGSHHPLNTGGSDSGAYAYGLPGGHARDYSFKDDQGGWKYIDAIHNFCLSELEQPCRTQEGLLYLTPELQLTDKSKNKCFPDECPTNISGSGPKLNIKEEYQLMKQLCHATGMKDTMYSKQYKNGTAERLAKSTFPFVTTHIHASTFLRENEISKKCTAPKTRGVIETLDDLLYIRNS